MFLANEPGTVFDYLFNLAKFGLGGKLRSGKQRVSWVHIEDFRRAIDWLIDTLESDGVYNFTSSGPARNEEMMAMFRKIAGRWFGLPSMK